MVEDVAGRELGDEHRRHPLERPAGAEEQARRATALEAARETVGPVHLAVGADVDGRLRDESAPDPLDREPAAIAAGAARVGNEAVALDQIGQSLSASSTGMFAMLAHGFARPSFPSATGRPPQVPTTSSL